MKARAKILIKLMENKLESAPLGDDEIRTEEDMLQKHEQEE